MDGRSGAFAGRSAVSRIVATDSATPANGTGCRTPPHSILEQRTPHNTRLATRESPQMHLRMPRTTTWGIHVEDNDTPPF